MTDLSPNARTDEPADSSRRPLSRTELNCGLCLAAYLLLTAGLAAAQLIPFFSIADVAELNSASGQQIKIALWCGVIGGFLHSSQSLITYLGNHAFRMSWLAWYLVRPWQGAAVGLVLYIVTRTGLVTGSDAANPFGAAALGLLGGWFSKDAMDKMQEIFAVAFKSGADKERLHKLAPVSEPPAPGNDASRSAAAGAPLQVVPAGEGVNAGGRG